MQYNLVFLTSNACLHLGHEIFIKNLLFNFFDFSVFSSSKLVCLSLTYECTVISFATPFPTYSLRHNLPLSNSHDYFFFFLPFFFIFLYPLGYPTPFGIIFPICLCQYSRCYPLILNNSSVKLLSNISSSLFISNTIASQAF